jgi:hypothetical protein
MRGAVDQGGRLRDPRLRAAVGSLIFLVVMPGVAAGLVPWGLTGWEVEDPPLILSALGYVILAAGVAVLLHAFVRFVVEGVGTPGRSRRLGTWSSAACTATSATRCT